MAYVWYTVGFDSRQNLKLSKKQRIRATGGGAGGLRKFSTRRPPICGAILEIAKIQHSGKPETRAPRAQLEIRVERAAA